MILHPLPEGCDVPTSQIQQPTPGCPGPKEAAATCFENLGQFGGEQRTFGTVESSSGAICCVERIGVVGGSRSQWGCAETLLLLLSLHPEHFDGWLCLATALHVGKRSTIGGRALGLALALARHR
jgi:hypothetical protein